MRRPEILAPAGDRDALAAALAAGADAVYFGLDDGFNARARAANFPSAGLREIVDWVHRAGARAYVAMNTLVFEPELSVVEELLRRVAAAGIDAIIVQDPAVALLARELCPALEVHGSTQMTASSPLAVGLLRDLGLTRVVVPRELSIEEIRAYRAGISGEDHGSSTESSMTRGVELEVFVHGALCVAWSGQCLSSEAWGGRSANRGQCAQACRLPYKLVVDNVEKDLGEVEYLLSPKDLVGLDSIAALAEIGVASLKIEGRLKGPAYVATAVAQYRRAAGDAVGEPPPSLPVDIPLDPESLHVAYSRGISSGFLAGSDHQTLVEGRFPRHRGLPLGRVIDVSRDWVTVVEDPEQRPVTGGRGSDTQADSRISDDRHSDTSDGGRISVVRAGMGVVFDRGAPEKPEEGGPIFGVEPTHDGYRLRFGDPGPNLANVSAGDFVWVSSDPKVTRAGDKAAEAGRGLLGRIAIDLSVRGKVGESLVIVATAKGHIASVRSPSILQPARGAGITAALVADKIGSFGGTAFHLGALDASALDPALHVPVSELKELRRAIVAELDAAVVRIERTVVQHSVIDAVRARVIDTASARAIERGGAADRTAAKPPMIVPLCRNDAQLDALLEAGATEIELDWMELVGLGRAVDRAKARGVRVTVATVRVQKPGEERIDAHLSRLEPDAILVRSWGSLAYFTGSRPALHGDFSLNVTNSITAGWVLARGLETITAAHDLDREQLFALLDAAPRGRVAVTVHHHIPTFHTEHCVYAHLLSTGKDFRDCGRPCEQHQVALKDRVGLVHPVVVDVGCRNTVFNAQAQSAAALVPDLLARGVTRFRLELVRETAEETRRLFAAYSQLVAGGIAPAEVVRVAEAHEQFGVTRGTMRTLTVLR
ncbi:MAG: ydcP [Myxococcales bacterium]|nr:ydcP [Myxococcales bacterium]